MKFKVTKGKIEDLLKCFERQHTREAEIELDLVKDTASEAILYCQMENNAFHKGYHRGFKEGFYQGRKPEIKYCMCGCGGNNCQLRYCDENCPMFNL